MEDRAQELGLIIFHLIVALATGIQQVKMKTKLLSWRQDWGLVWNPGTPMLDGGVLTDVLTTKLTDHHCYILISCIH